MKPWFVECPYTNLCLLLISAELRENWNFLIRCTSFCFVVHLHRWGKKTWEKIRFFSSFCENNLVLLRFKVLFPQSDLHASPNLSMCYHFHVGSPPPSLECMSNLCFLDLQKKTFHWHKKKRRKGRWRCLKLMSFVINIDAWNFLFHI